MRKLWKRMAAGLLAVLMVFGSVDLAGLQVQAAGTVVETGDINWKDAEGLISAIISDPVHNPSKLLADAPGKMTGPKMGTILDHWKKDGVSHIKVKLPFNLVHGDKNLIGTLGHHGIVDGNEVWEAVQTGTWHTIAGRCEWKGAKYPTPGSDAVVYYKEYAPLEPTYELIGTTGGAVENGVPQVSGWKDDEPGRIIKITYQMSISFVAYAVGQYPVQPSKGSFNAQSVIYDWKPWGEEINFGGGGGEEEEIKPGYLKVHKLSAHPQFDAWNKNYSLNQAEFAVDSCEPMEGQVDGSGSPMTSAVHANVLTKGAPDPTHRDSESITDEVELPVGSTDVQEVEAPKGFAINTSIVSAQIEEDGHHDVSFENEPYRSPAKIFLYKDDAEMLELTTEQRDGISTREPQGDGVFSGALFHVSIYSDATEFKQGMDPIISFDAVSKDLEGKDYGMIDFSQNAISNFKHWKDDSFVLSDYFVDDPGAFSFPLGYVVVTEIKAPAGYTLEDPNQMVMIDHSNAEEAVTYGPQFCFTVTEQGGTMLDKNGKDPSESLDANTVMAEYATPAAFAEMTAQMNKEAAENATDRTHVMQWTRQDENSNVIQVQIVTPVLQWEDGYVFDPSKLVGAETPPSIGVLGWKTITKEFTVTDKWLECCKGRSGAFIAEYGSGSEVLSIRPYSDAELEEMFGDNYNYYVFGDTTVFGSVPGTVTPDFLTPELKALCVTVNGAAPEIGYDQAQVTYRGVTFDGCFYATDASGNRVYLVYRDVYYNKHKDEVPDKMEEWGGIPLSLRALDGSPAKQASDVVISYVQTTEKPQELSSEGTNNAALATEPYLIKFEHEFHAYEQVIRGDVQVEKWDYEKQGPEATGASYKSNSTVDHVENYSGTHLDKVRFAIYNISNHYVVDPVAHKVVRPNEMFCTIDTHWNEQLQTYTAETTGGRLPFGTYAIREWHQDLQNTYNLSDTQARIFEIRKNGKCVWNDADGAQWGLTWTTDPDHWDDTAEWIRYPYNSSNYDNELTDDNKAKWEKAEAGRRSGKEDGYSTYTKGSAVYEARVVSEGWKVNEDTTGMATQKVNAADVELRDNKEKMIFKNFPVRSDIVVKKVRDTLGTDTPVSALFILENVTTGERHLITTDENGEYSSAPTQIGNSSFADHHVNTNALDVLLDKIDEYEKTETEIRAWPDTVEIGGKYGELPSQFFNINPETRTFSWNMQAVGGLWFSKGENGTYTTYVREFFGNDNAENVPSYVDKTAEELNRAGRSPQTLDLGHTELTDDPGKVTGIPRTAVIQDPSYTQDPGWNIKQAGNILINNFWTSTSRGNEYRLQNTDADTSLSLDGHQVAFISAWDKTPRSGIPDFVRGFLGSAGGDALGSLYKDGGADHTGLNNVNAADNNMPNNGTKDNSDKQAVVHIDGYHQDTRKAGLTDHVFGALPYGEYLLTEVRTTETMNDHLLKFGFKVTSQGEIKDLGTIEDKVVAPKLKTQAYDMATGTQVGLALENWQGYDEVYYEGLDPRSTYTMEASLYDLTAKEPVRYKDGTEVKVQMQFTPEKNSGTVTMVFGEDRAVDMTPYRGHKIIVYEVCYNKYREPVADHVDDADEHQMIYFPALDSEADQASVMDKKVNDNVTYDQVKGTDGYIYAGISSIIKSNGLPLTKTDMELFKEKNVLRDGNGQLIPAAEGSKIRHLFTAESTLPEGEEYNLEVALWDETTHTYVYDRYNADGTLLYDSLNGYGVFSMMGDDGRFFEAYYNPLKQEYMLFDGGTEWLPISGGYPVVGELASRSVKDDDGYVHEEVISPQVSKPAVKKVKLTASELKDTVVTEFTVDTSVLSGHEITSRHILYASNVDISMNLVQNHEVGGMFAPAAYQFSDMKLKFPVEFAEKEDARDGVLAENTPYKLIAYLMDGTGSNLKDRYGNKVTWQYGVAAGSSTYTAKDTGVDFIDVSFLTGLSSIGADKLFGQKLSVQLVAEQGSTKQIVVGEYPIDITLYGGTEYKKERHYYETDGTFLAAGTSVPAGGQDFKDNWKSLGAVNDTFWEFYTNPANYDGKEAYELAVQARKGYVYGLEDYVPATDDLHRVTVDTEGTLSNMSHLPFVYDAKGEAILDKALVTGLVPGEEYTLKVDFFENGTQIGTRYEAFMATEKSEYHEVYLYPVDASAKSGQHGPYTVKEEIRSGKIDLDHPTYDTLAVTDAKTGTGHADKELSWLRGLQFKEDEEGVYLTDDFGSKYKDMYLLAQKVFPQDTADGEFDADFKLEAGALRRAHANPVVFTNVFYVIDRMGNWGLADHHGSLSDTDEKVLFGEEDKKLGTTASVNGEKYVDKSLPVVTVTDIVSYEGYEDVTRGTLRTWLINRNTLERIPGTEKETPVTFDESGTGTFEVKVDVDLNKLPEGSAMVVYEELYDIHGVLIGEHKNPNDEGQTIHVGNNPDKEIGTTATVDGKKYVATNAGKVVVKDVVKYNGYSNITEAVFKGWLVNRVTGEVVSGTVKQQNVVLDGSGNGSFVMEFEIDTKNFTEGTKLVAFEELYDVEGKLIGYHKDINDEGQTITVTDNPGTPETPTGGPGLGTTATINGKKYALTDAGKVTITDTVEYHGYAGVKEGTFKGWLVNKKTGEKIEGSEISRKVTLNDSGKGTIEMEFTINTNYYKEGDKLVAFEELYDMDGKLIGSHKDTNDKDQTVTITDNPDLPETPTFGNNKPNLGTTATVNGQKTVAPGGTITITDRVSFNGYDAGEYTMAGYVVRKKDGSVLTDGKGKPISAKTKFTTDGSGTVDMTFTFNTDIFASGEQLVVYENMLDKNGKIVGSHLDLNDAAQTITFKNFRKVQTMMDDSAKGLLNDILEEIFRQ